MNTSAAELSALEERAKATGKTNLESYYFDGLGHGLGRIEWFDTGSPSTGYAALRLESFAN